MQCNLPLLSSNAVINSAQQLLTSRHVTEWLIATMAPHSVAPHHLMAPPRLARGGGGGATREEERCREEGGARCREHPGVNVSYWCTGEAQGCLVGGGPLVGYGVWRMV